MCPMKEVKGYQERVDALEDFDLSELDDDTDVIVYKCPECESIEIAYEG